jgi:hypothetical protein
MYLAKRHLSRRTFLRGTGVTMALPLLEAMIPAGTALAQTAAVPRKSRFVAVFFPHGMTPGRWVPEREGPLERLPYILEPLERVKDQTVVLSGLWSKSSESPPGTSGADHWVAAAYLTAFPPRKTVGADATVYSASIDQQIAAAIGGDTLLPSLQLATEDPNSSSSNCGEGYSCSYTNSISWVELPSQPGDPLQRTSPLPMELSPQTVFERMFGSGATAEERAERLRRSRSVLDAVRGELASLRARIGATDRQTVDQYSTEIREIERRLTIAAKASNETPEMDLPPGIPQQFEEHIRMHYDLTALALQADITRVVTLLGARDLTIRAYPYPRGEWYPDGGTSPSFHTASHHNDSATQMEQFAKLNRYHVSTTAYLAEKLKKIPDGDGTLLDHSLILHGTNMGNSNQHQHFDVAHVLIGGASGRVKGGRHIAYERKTVTSGSLLLSILDMYGVRRDRQGDGASPLPKL